MNRTFPISPISWIPISQAALISESSVREINRVIDENLLPNKMMRIQPSRALSVIGCAMARFYFKTATSLTKEERLTAIHAISENTTDIIRETLIFQRDWLTIDFTNFMRDTEQALNAFEKSISLIVSDPDVLGGEHVFKGTRIPVYMITETLAQGEKIDDILKAYPALSMEHIFAAQKFSSAYPRKGRPRRDNVTNTIHKTVRIKQNV